MLRCEGVCAAYGRVKVLQDVSLEVAAGEVVTVIGGNGAGKSTLLRVIGGLLPPAQGAVTFMGADITGMRAEHVVRRGVALVPEGRMLFAEMTVAENLRLGAYSRTGAAAKDEYAADLGRVQELFPVLADRSRQPASTLSGGEQQMLAMARALMARPRLLLLDEPSLGLAPRVITDIFRALDVLRRDGLTILLVEQDAKVALRHADRGYVMRTGRVVLTGSAEELSGNDDVRLIYLGAWHGKDATA
jgi:branched-chain amino acid transport system ATP-binding protein